MQTAQSNSEDCFAKALAAENAAFAANLNDAERAAGLRKAEMWLKLAVKREAEEKGLVEPAESPK